MELTNKKANLLNILRGVLMALALTIVLVLILAIIYKFVDMSDTTIKVINQVIKVASIGFGIFLCLKKDKKQGMLKGSTIGALYMLLSYLVFSLLVSSFYFSLAILYDLIFGAILGLLFGVIFVNFSKR